MDDEVGEDKDHQQAERRHSSAHPPELAGQSGNGELHPIHVFVNPAAGDYFELLVGIVELLKLVPRCRRPGQRSILQAVEPGQPLIEPAVKLAVGDGVAVFRQQHPIPVELLLVAGETAAIPSTAKRRKVRSISMACAVNRVARRVSLTARSISSLVS